MATTLSKLDAANRQLHADKAVIERRAEMAAQCECLAAWDSTRECICDKTFEMPLSVDNLRAANALVQQMDAVDENISRAEIIADDELVFCKTRAGTSGYFVFENVRHVYDDERERKVHFKLPKALIIAALNDERMRLQTRLAETGIVSVSRANIKAVPR